MTRYNKSSQHSVSCSDHTLAYIYTTGQVVSFGRGPGCASRSPHPGALAESSDISCLVSAKGMSGPTICHFVLIGVIGGKILFSFLSKMHRTVVLLVPLSLICRICIFLMQCFLEY